MQKAYKEPNSNTGLFEDATEEILKKLASYIPVTMKAMIVEHPA